MLAGTPTFRVTPAKTGAEPFTLWIGGGLTMMVASAAIAAVLLQMA